MISGNSRGAKEECYVTVAGKIARENEFKKKMMQIKRMRDWNKKRTGLGHVHSKAMKDLEMRRMVLISRTLHMHLQMR